MISIETMQHKVAFDLTESLAAKRGILHQTTEFDDLYIHTLTNVRKYDNETLADVYSFLILEA